MFKLLKSRTFWTLFVMFLVAGFQAVEQSIPTDIYMFINAGLTALAIYFKVNPSQKY